ncbi:unnamed protein product [Orchesella dallaii]|uniref:Uncharacterized protein n=1 Tax=Orchesella dallaii TaxID=48710 RepID=A0ABP1QYI3_9HEXA
MKKGLKSRQSHARPSKPTSAATSVKLLNRVTEHLAPENTIRDMCKIIAGDFYETAWEICSTRFYFERASETVISDLRDTWLSIIDMQFLDTDPDLFEQICIPDQIDVPPLPPKFDTWAHGALEVLPSRQRESVMDPFLREPLPWFLENLSGKNDDLLKRAPANSPAESWNDLDDDEEDEDEDFEEEENDEKKYFSHFSVGKLKLKSQTDSSLHLNRPSSPVSSEYSPEKRLPVGEATWSTTTTAGGSFVNAWNDDIDYNVVVPDESRTQLESPLSAGTMASAARKSESEVPKPLAETPVNSLELLFPSKFSRIPDIKASTEMEYRMGGGGSILEIGRSSQMIAFKLPGQSSSSALKHAKELRDLKSKEANAAARSSVVNLEGTDSKPSNQLQNTQTRIERRSIKSNPEILSNRVLRSKEGSIRRNVFTATKTSRQYLLDGYGKSKKEEFKETHKHKGVRIVTTS